MQQQNGDDRRVNELKARSIGIQSEEYRQGKRKMIGPKGQYQKV